MFSQDYDYFFSSFLSLKDLFLLVGGPSAELTFSELSQSQKITNIGFSQGGLSFPFSSQKALSLLLSASSSLSLLSLSTLQVCSVNSSLICSGCWPLFYFALTYWCAYLILTLSYLKAAENNFSVSPLIFRPSFLMRNLFLMAHKNFE